MSYVRGEDRGQAALLPAAIEDYVTADAPVRVIDAFVDGLDVKELGFGRSVPAMTGRPPYDPAIYRRIASFGGDSLFAGRSWTETALRTPVRSRRASEHKCAA